MPAHPHRGEIITPIVYFEILFCELRHGNVRILARLSSVADESFAKWYIKFSESISSFPWLYV